MKIQLSCVGTLEAALERSALLDRLAAEILARQGAQTSLEGASARRLRRDFAAKECLLVEARELQAERTVGVCWVAPVEDPLTLVQRPLILVLWVDPELRHRGLARALVQETRSLLRARGSEVLSARAAHNDDALISMGERWGFVRTWEWMELE